MADLREELSAALGPAFRIDQELSGGGMSRVYTAEDLTLGRMIVIKVLPPELSGIVSIERFRREILVAARLQHPHIVAVLSTGEMNGVPYYTMPFVDGESLRQRLQRLSKLSSAEVIAILRDVAKALAYAHERKIVHRDIKPDNVMLIGGSAVVTDFGIAKAISASREGAPAGSTLTFAGTSLGTPAYMAPEQAAGDPTVDHRADLYSFGCMAYEMLTGRPPFVEKTVHKLFAAHMAQLPDLVTLHRPDTPADLAAIVMLCLEKDPDDRPQTALEVLQRLELITSGGNPSFGSLQSFLGPQRTPRPVTPVSTARRPGIVSRALSSRTGLSILLAVVVGMNLLETAFDESISRVTGAAGWRSDVAAAMLSLERLVSFNGHELTNAVGAYSATIAYFFVFPALLLIVGISVARSRSVSALRVVVVAVAVAYLISLPFFVLLPVAERWSVPESGATILANELSSYLIEISRPMSGLDNCFPSSHASLTVIAVAASFWYRLWFRRAALLAGLAIVLSTFVLGIHWIADLVAGVAVGIISIAIAMRLERGWSRMSESSLAVTPRAVSAAALLLFAAVASPARLSAQTSLTFAAVALDAESQKADDLLRRYLEGKAGVTFVSQNAQEYGHVIDYLATRRPTDDPYVARVTPYALVAAELLGARVQVLGTYVSRATSATTYQSYLVVNRSRFPREPEPADIARSLRGAATPPTFAYHSEFSTSSYFLPAIYFRANDIFDMPAASERAAAIRSRKMGSGSSDLVKGVATGQFDIAAVWSGTKASFENNPDLRTFTSRVYFVPLPDALPNDLLVASASLDSATASRIRKALEEMPPTAIDVGDFLTWKSINDASEARDALANLRWLARAAPAPITVDVQRGSGGKGLAAVPDAYLAAARQAIRLAGLEFVAFDRDYHRNQDYVLTLTTANDGAILMRTRIVGSEAHNQEFLLTFRDVDELMARIASVLHARVHRVRYLWPYRTSPPTVLRDVDIALRAGTPVSARKILWLDPRRHSYSQGEEFQATISRADADKLELTPPFVAPADADGFGFNPMSNISYRVILPRLANERTMFRVLTVALLALLVGGMIVAGVDIRRRAVEGDIPRE